MRPSREFKTAVIGFVVIFGLLILAYLPLLRIPFVFNDDFLIFTGNIQKCSDHPQYYYFFMIGRPVFPLFSCPFWVSIDSINDLAMARFLNVFALSISAYVFYSWLKENRFSNFQSLMIATIVFVMPTFQTQVVLANSFPHMAALLSAIFCGKQLCYWIKDTNKKHILAASILLFFSLSIHPCVAMFFWPIVLVYFLNNTTGWHQLLKVIIWFFLICFLYFLFAKGMNIFVPDFFSIAPDIIGGHRVALTRDFIRPLQKLMLLSLAALNLWSVLPHSKMFIGVLLLIVTATVIKIKQLQNSSEKTSVTPYILLCLAFPLSLSPVLAAEYNALSYRMISAITAVVITTLHYSLEIIIKALPLRGWKNSILNSLLIILVICSLSKAQYNMTNYLAVPAYKELAFVKNCIISADIKRIDNIVVIRPEISNWLITTPVGHDEFGLISSAQPQNIKGLIRCAMIQLNLDEADFRRIVISSCSVNDKKKPLTPKTTLIINMNSSLFFST